MSDQKPAQSAEYERLREQMELHAFASEFWLEEAKHRLARLKATVAKLRALQGEDR